MFFGAVGKDKLSDILKIKANEDGVDVKYQYNSEKPTGNNYIFMKLVKYNYINIIFRYLCCCGHK